MTRSEEKRALQPGQTGLRLTLVGLGDVGGTLLTALNCSGLGEPRPALPSF